MSIILETTEISGLAIPSYNSGAVNKKYVDDVSGNSKLWYDELYAPTGAAGDISSQVTLSSGLTSDASIYHDGETTDLFLDADQDFTSVSSQSISGGTIKGHLPSSQLQDWFDGEYYPSTMGHSDYLHSSNNNIHLKGVSSPLSGQTVIYGSDTSNATWQNVYPPVTYILANSFISANQNWNIGRFTTPGTTSAYVLQAYTSDSGGKSVGDLNVQMLSGTTLMFSESSNIFQQYSNPSSATGDLEFRFTYSGASNPTGYQYGNCLIQIGVW